MSEATGAEIWKFWQEGWPAYHYTEDSEIEVEGEAGKCLLNPATLYDLDRFGVVVSEKTGEYKDFSYYFKKWKRDQTSTTIVIEVSKEREKEIREFLRMHGVKAVKA